jgi:hypothetical protein
LFPVIVNYVKTNIVIVNVLFLIRSLIEWSDNAFQDKDIALTYFQFVNWVRSEIKLNSPKIPQILRSLVQAVIADVTTRLNIHLQVNDYSTRRIDSNHKINEKLVIARPKLKNPKIYRYTVGPQLLVSFIEEGDGTSRLVVFAPGGFGKSIWTLSDDCVGEGPPANSSRHRQSARPTCRTKKRARNIRPGSTGICIVCSHRSPKGRPTRGPERSTFDENGHP